MNPYEKNQNIFIIGGLAFLIVMIQPAPTCELFTQSLRSQAGYDAKTHLASLHPLHTLTLFYPYLFGWPGCNSYWGSTYEFWAPSFYVGIIPLGFCLLAGLLFFKVKKTRSGNLSLELYCCIFFLAFAVVMNLSPDISEKMVDALRPTPSQALEDFRRFVENVSGTAILSDGSHLRRLGFTVWFSTFFMIIICVILWRRFSGKLPANYLVAGVVFFTALDLIGHAAMGISFFDKSVNFKKPGIVETVAGSLRNQRIMTQTDGFQQYAYGFDDRHTLDLGIDALTGEVGLSQHLFRTEGKGVLKVKNFSDFSGFRSLPYPFQLKILQFLNVKQVLHFKSSSIKDSESVEQPASYTNPNQVQAVIETDRDGSEKQPGTQVIKV